MYYLKENIIVWNSRPIDVYSIYKNNIVLMVSRNKKEAYGALERLKNIGKGPDLGSMAVRKNERGNR